MSFSLGESTTSKEVFVDCRMPRSATWRARLFFCSRRAGEVGGYVGIIRRVFSFRSTKSIGDAAIDPAQPAARFCSRDGDQEADQRL